MRLALGEGPGELARLLGAVAEFGIGSGEVALEPAAANGGGLAVRLAVGSGGAETVRRRLAAEGWTVLKPELRRGPREGVEDMSGMRRVGEVTASAP
ncbi:hypothetical protein ACFUJR_17240 [Streptomyces sp. NPDC057271]|uniref:hypothetical protein n=1 Tax=unclassified Streptomyces TaxID=2593676 RepID=UPI0036345118